MKQPGQFPLKQAHTELRHKGLRTIFLAITLKLMLCNNYVLLSNERQISFKGAFGKNLLKGYVLYNHYDETQEKLLSFISAIISEYTAVNYAVWRQQK